MSISNHIFNEDIIVKAKIGYKLYLPKKYDDVSTTTWPLILFLHGIKKRGNDLSVLDGYGLVGMVENEDDFPFIVLAPQCPSFGSWPAYRNEVIALLNQVIADHRVDRSRIYLTGFSMGGNGAWDLAAHSSKLFAAVAPVAGWYEAEAAPLLKDIPIWAFHGEADDVVAVSGSIDMVRAVNDVGGDARFTGFPELKHYIMSETYSNAELYGWFLAQEKVKPTL